MNPAPWIYLAALALGVALGVVLDVWMGWLWWAVTLAVVAAVWLLFLSSAFMGPRRGSSLGDELVDAISPGRAPERRARRAERLIRARPFPVYGLDGSWKGERMLGGHGMRGGKLSNVELTHGDPIHGPWVRIESAPKAARSGDLREIAAQLWHGVERPPPDVLPDLREDWIRRRAQERRARNAQWTRVSIPVEGEPKEFHWLDETSDWAARGHIGDIVVTIHAHGVPIKSVRLARITNVEPYIEGDRRFPGEA